ncbi:MAG TPA: hypothetical protein ENK57_12195 [Polyangiaceae bacterium]|nr:hypothetical protein [Polyangiaceae bacterium]
MSAAEQLALFEFRPVPAPSTRADEIEERARIFVKKNPEVWRLFVRFTHELIRAGRANYSARAVLHRIRWHAAIQTEGDDYKINDHVTPVFARWFHEAYPEHAGFFRTRERTSSQSRPRGQS